MLSVRVKTLVDGALGSHIKSAGHALGLNIGKRLLVEYESGGQIVAVECTLGVHIVSVQSALELQIKAAEAELDNHSES